MVLSGPYRDETKPDAEVKQINLVARVAWREQGDGSVDTDSEGYPKLVVYDWPDPRLYGLPDPRPSLWAAWRVPPDDGEPHRARSLMVLEHGVGTDVQAYVLARLWASTGAAGSWYTADDYITPAFGLDPAVLEPGPNDLGLEGVGDELLGRFTDAEGPT
jgi:hypothetical protein